ncbi:glutamate--tRNA ligase [Petrotoga sp. 9PWA.NaAc.5.4]|uniref:glutamate--tRNA ligase n=1 Tax=Petrotoga sp. 9PWA.NaAc.5.4 TaxID=1434328 RepID=UPI000CCA56BF|nr:glutamate--tRNA ligase [Petrotoga sp. 9PWA.NaAc.5.4]PNR94620.1 glutamyl-tRNA synthetase [Petrotoga sp. 9PWA.NaAc.5.4]
MVRVRFAPSPTGHLHVGGLRTALFNWYFARKTGGKFIIRIEDTDLERSKNEYEQAIIEELKWSGLDYDESIDCPGEYGPYRQSERLEIYKKYVEQLLNENKAYYCVYDKENIVYENNILEDKYKNNKNYSIVIKFKVEKNNILSFNDLIRGPIEFDTNYIEDFVIVRSNGIPVYNFTVVIDDYLMKISHIIRGEDHISNTPKQILLYKAFSFDIPEFAHLPLIVGEDRTPLSKRHGEVSITYFRREGYLPNALLNYLSLLGWNAEEQVFDYREKIRDFDLKNVSKNPAVFDYNKLLWINEAHLRNDAIDKVLKDFEAWIDYSKIDLKTSDKSYVKKVVEISRKKVQTLKQLYEFSKNFFRSDFEYEQEFIEKYASKEWFKDVINLAINKLSNVEVFDFKNIEVTLKEISNQNTTTKKNIFQAIRGAVLGRLVTPGLYESLETLGKEETLNRLNRALRLF